MSGGKMIGGNMDTRARPRRRAALAVTAMVAMLAGTVVTGPLAGAAKPKSHPLPSVAVDHVRTLELDDAGVIDPVGFTVSADGRRIYVVEAANRGVVAVVGAHETDEGTLDLGSPAPERPALAFDPTAGSVVVSGRGTDHLVELPVTPGTQRRAANQAELPADAFADGIAIGADGTVHGLAGDRFTSRPGRVPSDGKAREVDLGGVLVGEGRGVAVDPSGNVYVGDPAGSQVVVLDQGGEPRRTLDLTGAGVENLRDIGVAPSGDSTDAAGTLSLYVVDERSTSEGTDLRMMELTAGSTTAPTIMTMSVPVTDTATAVQAVDTSSDISPPSPDPSGLAWMPEQERLLMADGEINEYSYYAGATLWTLDTGAPPSVLDTGTTVGWSAEPTGVAFDAASNRMFVTDDNVKRIYEVQIGADGVPGTADDVVVRSFDTTAFGYDDPEDLVFDATRGWLHAVDGSNREVFTIDPGPNGVFQGGGDDVITQFDVHDDGVGDAEGIAYDPLHDTLTVIDYSGTTAVEYDLGGAVRRLIDLGNGSGLVHPAGATWAPSSSGSGTSLWVVDRGEDGEAFEDGKLIEFSVPPLGGQTAGPDVNVTPESVSFGSVETGSSVDSDVLVANVGSGPLSVTATTLSGPDAGLFSIVSGGGSFTLQPGQSRTVSVDFSPAAVGDFSASLTVASDDPDEAAVSTALSGSGVSEHPPTDEVTVTGTVQGGSTSQPSVSTGVPVSVDADRLYVTYVATKGYEDVTGVSGLGATWSPVASQCSGRNQTGISAFATTSASTSSLVTATLDGAPSNAAIAVVEYAGVDLDDPFGATSTVNTNGVAGACAGGTDSTTYSVDISVSAESMVVGAVATRHRLHDAGAGFVDRVEFTQGTGGSASGVAVEDKVVDADGPVTVDGALSGDADWSAIALEIRAAGTDPEPLPTITPVGGVVQEGDSGTTTLDVVVELSAPSANTVTVDWATVDAAGEPEDGVDYESASGTLTFAPGETSEVVPITVFGDTVDEPGQLFGAEWGAVSFSNPTNAEFGSGFFAAYALALIADDD